MSLHDKAMLVALSLSKFGLNRKDDDEAREVARRHGADSKSWAVTKRLLQGNTAFDAIRKFDTAFSAWNRKQTLPWDDNGTRLLPTVNYDPYMAHVRLQRTAREGLVRAFLNGYDSFVSGDRTTLGSAWNPRDYPDRYIVREKFGMELAVTPVPDAKDFRITVSKADLLELQRNVADQLRNAEDKARRELFGRLAEPLLKMAEKLADRDKKMTLTTTVPLIENLREIIELIPTLNIIGDANLEAFRRVALEKLAHITPETLKSNDLVRTVAARHAQEIVDAMSDFMGPAPVAVAA